MVVSYLLSVIRCYLKNVFFLIIAIAHPYPLKGEPRARRESVLPAPVPIIIGRESDGSERMRKTFLR